MECLLAPQALGGALEELERVAVAAADGRDVEALLRPEEPEEVRLGDTRPLGDVLGRGREVAPAADAGVASKVTLVESKVKSPWKPT